MASSQNGRMHRGTDERLGKREEVGYRDDPKPHTLSLPVGCRDGNELGAVLVLVLDAAALQLVGAEEP